MLTDVCSASCFSQHWCESGCLEKTRKDPSWRIYFRPRRPLVCSCSSVSPPLLQCTNLLLIFFPSLHTHLSWKTSPPSLCCTTSTSLFTQAQSWKRSAGAFYTVHLLSYLFHLSRRMFSENMGKWSSCICDIGVGPWLCALFLSFSDFLILPGFIDFTADEVVSFYACSPLSLLIRSKTVVFVLLARLHRSTSPSCLVIFDQCGHALAAPSPLCLYCCLVGRSPTSFHGWRS